MRSLKDLYNKSRKIKVFSFKKMAKANVQVSSSIATTDEPESRPDVITKYRTTADITNEVLKQLIARCVSGVDVHTLCTFGDSLIEEKVEKVYARRESNQKMKKGVSFPTCISVNEMISNFSPLPADTIKLAAGDLVKIQLGAHIDGYNTLVAHSIVVDEPEIVGRKADVLRAAWNAAEAALRTIEIGVDSTAVTAVMKRCVEPFKCKLVERVMCRQLKQHVIEALKSFPIQESPDERVTPVVFEMHEVYGINVVVSTGEGKSKPSDYRTCIFCRNVEQNYVLKTPMGRQFLREVTTRFPTLPFATRSIQNEKLCCLGLSECQRHELLEAYPVLTERSGEFVAQFQFTVMLLPGGAKRVTGLPFAQDAITKSSFSITDPALLSLLAKSLNPKKKKHQKKALKESDTPIEESQ